MLEHVKGECPACHKTGPVSPWRMGLCDGCADEFEREMYCQDILNRQAGELADMALEAHVPVARIEDAWLRLQL